MAPVYLMLLHHPILDRQGEIITTAVTNLDIHDGCRLCATYGMLKYFIITPLHEQLSLVHRVRSHWVEGPGSSKTPTRRKALEKLSSTPSFRKACNEIAEYHGQPPLLIGTSARQTNTKGITYSNLRTKIEKESQPIAIVFGTGWGIAHQELDPTLDFFLPPIHGPTEYNHLSVRAAMAITLDRVLSPYHKQI